MTDEISIKELCKPISAKKMPKRLSYTISGKELPEHKALAAQRKAIGERWKSVQRRSKAVQPIDK